MDLDAEALEAARARDKAEKDRAFHALKAREAELQAKIGQVSLDRINLERELAKTRAALAKQGG